MSKKYKIITTDLQKNLIEFLDEIQFDAAKEGSTEDMHKVNFCTWAINELLNGYDAYFRDRSDKPKPQSKSRDDYVEETFPQLNACISTNKGAVVIHRKEYDKSQILSEYDNPIYVTDTVKKYSYDYHISQKVKTIHIGSPDELSTIAV